MYWFGLAVLTDVPSTPLNLSAVNIFDNKMTLTWSQSPLGTKEATVKYYEVQYHVVVGNQNESVYQVIIRDGRRRRQTIRGLLPNTTYAVKLCAVSNVGKSFWANTKVTTASKTLFTLFKYCIRSY
jgi:hypothetical protein